MIEEYFKRALAQYEKVLIPGLGTFTSYPTGAKFDEEDKIISPPDVAIDFSPDTLALGAKSLTDFIAESSEDADYTNIESHIADFVFQVKEALDAEGYYEVEGLGLLKKTVEGDIRFDKDEDVNLNVESYGLPKLTAEPVYETQITANTSQVKKAPSDLVLLLILIPLLVITVFAIYFIINPSAYDKLVDVFTKEEAIELASNSTKGEADNNPGKTTPVGQKESESKPVSPTSEKEKGVSPAGQDTKNPQKNTKPSTPSPSGSIITSKTGRYYVIIGSYSTVKNAQVAVKGANEKGYSNAKILQSGTSYRVSIDDRAGKGDGSKAAQDAKKDYSGAWLLHY
ncbi:SPOR domain-containing protein [Rapidithrix thailandica]|uniref:SPOR domain-containing protein n=1 Tax=Rapidithrix thailandica TaxID=413964 RepID=A0AAW9S9Y5_9BACT